MTSQQKIREFVIKTFAEGAWHYSFDSDYSHGFVFTTSDKEYIIQYQPTARDILLLSETSFFKTYREYAAYTNIINTAINTDPIKEALKNALYISSVYTGNFVPQDWFSPYE